MIRRLPSRPRLITTAIEYPNGAPHLGHGYEKILADVRARHFIARGEKVRLTLGLDEHSQKVTAEAARRDLAPQTFCDSIEPVYHRAWRALDLSPYTYVRTSTPEHRAVVTNLLNRAYAQGDIYRGVYTHFRCTACGPEIKPHVKDGKCRAHGIAAEAITEPSYFFRLSRYAERIYQHHLDHPEFVRPETHRKTILARLEKDLREGTFEDISISRRSTWGIALPFAAAASEDELAQSSVTYVWFDALANYLTAAQENEWPADTQVIGHDIARFHAVLWPGMLMAAGLPLPRQLWVHGHLQSPEKDKLSKSLGDGEDSLRAGLQFGSDGLRYYLSKQIALGRDYPFDADALGGVVRNDLTAKFGGVVRRLESIVSSEFGGHIPGDVAATPDPAFMNLWGQYETAMADDVHDGALRLFDLILHLNKAVSAVTQRERFKPEAQAKAREHTRTFLESLRLLALAAWPVMPQAGGEILRRLGIEAAVGSEDAGVSPVWQSALRPAVTLSQGAPLF